MKNYTLRGDTSKSKMASSSKLPNLVRSTAGAVPVLNEKGRWKLIRDNMTGIKEDVCVCECLDQTLFLLYFRALHPSTSSTFQPLLLDAGELTMQKVKVARYVSGRRPDYAPQMSGSESSEEEEEDRFGGVAEPGSPARLELEVEEAVRTTPFLPTHTSHPHTLTCSLYPLQHYIGDRRLRRLHERGAVVGEREGRARRVRELAEPEVIYEAGEAEEEEEGEEEEEEEEQLPRQHILPSDSER